MILGLTNSIPRAIMRAAIILEHIFIGGAYDRAC